MKRTIALFTAFVAVLTLSLNGFAAEPDKPGTKFITIQAGGLPGYGGILSGNIAMANLGATHLYGGLQLGADYRNGSHASSIDLSLAPRLMLGVNVGKVVELHIGGFAGVGLRKFNPDDHGMDFLYSLGGFGGLRLNLSDSLAIVAEGCYAPHMARLPFSTLPYVMAGLAFRL